MNRITGLFMIFVVAVLTAVPVLAQDSEEEAKVAPKSSSFPVADPMENKIYEIKHQTAQAMRELLTGMATVYISEQFNTVTVRATPAVHNVVASIIEKYDVPQKTIEFQFFLIKAGNAPGDFSPSKIYGLPEKVATTLNEVAGLTRYKSFQTIDAPFMRTRAGNNVETTGSGEDSYLLRLQGVGVSGEANNHRIRINDFNASFSVQPYRLSVKITDTNSKAFGGTTTQTKRNVSINTSLEFTEGEMIVVGTTQAQSQNDSDSDTSVIVIVTAKIL